MVQGSLRVTDTTYTTDLNISSVTASKIAKIDTNKNLTSGDLAASEIPNLSTDKLTSGTLGVARGGTGATTFTSGALLIGNGTSAVGTRSITNNTSNAAITNNTNIPTMNTIYYGLVTVNNASQTRATGIYAPTTAGTANQILVSKGGTNAPEWTIAATLASATNATSGTAAYTNLTLGNDENVSSATAHSEGKITLYSAATNAHIIQGQSTTNDITHTLPNDTGILVSLNSGTAKGSATKPVYVPNTGIITECNTYAGGTAVTLNGENKSAATASFYAPITYGTAGYILKANGESEAPFWVEKVSYNNLPTNDSFILTEGSNSINPPATAQATIPSNYALNRKIFYSQNEPSVTNADLGMFWFQPASFTMEDLKCLIVGVVATNTTSVTINNDDITTDMVVVKCVLSNPSAQTGDLTWTTTGKDPEDPNSHGNIVINGTINGTTNMTFYLIHAR